MKGSASFYRQLEQKVRERTPAGPQALPPSCFSFSLPLFLTLALEFSISSASSGLSGLPEACHSKNHVNDNEPNVCVKGRGRGRRFERIPVSWLSSWIADREKRKWARERMNEVVDWITTTSTTLPLLFSWHGGGVVGRDTPHCSVSPIPVLHKQTHFFEWIHSFFFSSFVIFLSTSLRLLWLLNFSPSLPPCSLSELSHTSLSHSFCHGQGKENDRPTSHKSKRRTTVKGELRPDMELQETPPDGLSWAENSERQREKKEPCLKLEGGDDCSCSVSNIQRVSTHSALFNSISCFSLASPNPLPTLSRLWFGRFGCSLWRILGTVLWKALFNLINSFWAETRKEAFFPSWSPSFWDLNNWSRGLHCNRATEQVGPIRTQHLVQCLPEEPSPLLPNHFIISGRGPQPPKPWVLMIRICWRRNWERETSKEMKANLNSVFEPKSEILKNLTQWETVLILRHLTVFGIYSKPTKPARIDQLSSLPSFLVLT